MGINLNRNFIDMIRSKKVFFIMAFLLLLSCRKPIIKEFVLQPERPVITANQNFSRTGLQEFIIQDSLKILYSDDLIGLPFSSYLQYAGELIFTTHNGYLYFVSLNDFSDIRKTNIADGIGTAPSIHGKTLFLTVNKGDVGLIAYDMASGKIKWTIPGMLSQSSPVLTEMKVIHASINGSIIAYNILDGSRTWQVEYSGPILNNLAMTGKNLIVAGQDGNISNYNPETGVLNWALQLEGAIYASPVINSNFVFISTYSGSVIQIELNSGNIKNRFNGKVELFQTPVLDDQNLYILLANGKIIALDETNLNIKWQKQLDGPFSAPPLLASMEILVGTGSKKLYRLNKFTGDIIQILKLEGRPRAQPIYYKNKIYLSYEPDILTVLSTKRGSDE